MTEHGSPSSTILGWGWVGVGVEVEEGIVEAVAGAEGRWVSGRLDERKAGIASSTRNQKVS